MIQQISEKEIEYQERLDAIDHKYGILHEYSPDAFTQSLIAKLVEGGEGSGIVGHTTSRSSSSSGGSSGGGSSGDSVAGGGSSAGGNEGGGSGAKPENRDQKWQDTKRKEQQAGMNSDQMEARTYYVTQGYASVNGTLRNPGRPGSEYTDKRNLEYAKNLKSSFIPIGENVRVYRGVNAEHFPIKVGTVFEDKGFVSTSVHKNIAQRFSKTAKKTVMVIDLHKTVRVGFGSLDSEGEIILPPGSKFRIRKIVNKKTTYVHAEIVP